MRFKNSYLWLLLAVGVFVAQAASYAAQAPAGAKAAAAKPAAAKPVAAKAGAGRNPGTLIQVMRGVLFNNSNIIFDVQQEDPGAPIKPTANELGTNQTKNFANVYAGWQVIENAAVALDESVDTILKARMCANGIPAPIGQADYRKTALELRTVSRKILKAAQEKNREKVNDLSGDLSEACAACHVLYRDPEGPKGFGDTTVRCKVPPPAPKPS